MNQLYNLQTEKGLLSKILPPGHKFKLILIDIDGTLTKDSKTVTPGIQKIVKKIQKKLMVSLISSRSRHSAYNFIKKLNLRSYHVLENGATIVNPNFKPIFRRYIQKNTLKKLYKYLTDNQFNFNICVDGITRYPKKEADLKFLPYKNITRVSMLNVGENNLDSIENSLRKIGHVNYSRAFDKLNSRNFNIDITSDLASKEKALKYLYKLMRISKLDTIGIGDGYNDIPFIKNVFLKVAMGNAVYELKKIADIIAPPVGKNGLAQILETIYKNL